MPKHQLVFILSLSVSAFAQDKLLSVEDLYGPDKKIELNDSFPSGLRWCRDGRHLIERRRGSIWEVEALSGEAKALFQVEEIQAGFETVGFDAKKAQEAAKQGRKVLSPTEKGVLIQHEDDLFYYRFTDGRLIRLTNGVEEEQEAAFSPSGELLAFVRDHDLYAVSVDNGQHRRLTRDGSCDILNGVLDWVYQEEIFGRGDFKGFWWSPDSKYLAYLQLDESAVPASTVGNHGPVHMNLEPMKYPKAGDPNPTVRLGIVSVDEGRISWAHLQRYQTEDFLIVGVRWKPDSSKVAVQIQNREQTWLDLNWVYLNGKTERVLRETSEAWVDVLADPFWLEDGSFLWQSERSGFRHLYHYSSDGHLKNALTSGAWEVRRLEAVDESEGLLYFSGTRDTVLETHLYQSRMDGKALSRITKEDGDHKVLFSPSCSYFVDTWSDVSNPPQLRLVDRRGVLVRVLAERKAEVLRDYRLGTAQFIRVAARDGFGLNALMIKPPGFEPDKKYPVLCHTYNGPHSHQINSQKVRNRWGGTGYLWHQLLAQKGYIIWICDSRTASGKGLSSAWPAYRNLGEVELRDMEDMVDWLQSQPFVDDSRIGLWGWSYGGFMTIYALTHSESFRMGIAGAPVTDWTLYDSVYTERYMGLPADNREGYRKSSTIESAVGLKGRLLVIHGAMDENVHVQNTYKLADRLQRAGKQFELMIYPQSRHSIQSPRRLKHLKDLMTQFILANL